MFNAGQSCCGIERAYVHKDVYEEFLTMACKLIETYKIGDPKDKSTSLGPLAQAKTAEIMRAQVDEAVQRGAKVLTGGHSQKINHGTFFEATLLAEVKNDM